MKLKGCKNIAELIDNKLFILIYKNNEYDGLIKNN